MRCTDFHTQVVAALDAEQPGKRLMILVARCLHRGEDPAALLARLSSYQGNRRLEQEESERIDETIEWITNLR